MPSDCYENVSRISESVRAAPASLGHSEPEWLPLSRLSVVLAAETGRRAPKHRSLYAQVLDGVIPAEFINGRWRIKRADVPEIAAKLGLRQQAGPVT